MWNDGILIRAHGEGWLLYLEQGSSRPTLFITGHLKKQLTWESIKDIAPPPFQVVTSPSLGVLNNYYGGLGPGDPGGTRARSPFRSFVAVPGPVPVAEDHTAKSIVCR